MATPALQCRESRSSGDAVALEGGGETVPLLPRSACFIRMHRGRLPPTVSSVLSGAPDLDAHVLWLKENAPSEGAGPAAAAGADGIAAAERRSIYSADVLPPQRELQVYDGTGETFVGKIIITAEHKLSDVVQMVRDDFAIHTINKLYRGIDGHSQRMPLHPQQYDRLAITFFPSESHRLLVG